MKKFLRIMACFLVLVSLIATVQTNTVQAYFNRGTVQLSLATTTVNMKTGESYNISVSMSPASYTGLPGCGLAQCPHGCLETCQGHMNDNNGQCQCGGYVQQTANASLNVSSANTMIATANYSSGVLTITGIRAGQTTITVQGTLWEHQSSASQVINVTVTKPSSGGTGSGDGSGTTNTPGSGTTVETVAPGAKNTSGTNQTNSNDGATGSQTESTTATAQGETESSSTENEKRTVDTPMRGTVEIVTLNNMAATGKTELETAKERGTSVTFQKLDSGEKVIYSWTFEGKDITNPKDIELGIELRDSPPALKSKAGQFEKPLYISFAHEGKLPGKAKITISVGDKYKDGDKLSLYYLNEDKDSVDLVSKDLVVENGYIDFEINHCSDYALSAGITEKAAGSTSPVLFIVLAVVVVVLAAGGAFIFIKKRRIVK